MKTRSTSNTSQRHSDRHTRGLLVKAEVVIAALILLVLSAAPPVFAHARPLIRVSVKVIADESGNRPVGNFASHSQIEKAIAEANRVLENSEAEWRLVLTEIDTVHDASPFLNMDEFADAVALENAALDDPTTYAWRDDAINIFVVNTFTSTSGGFRGVFRTGQDYGLLNQIDGVPGWPLPSSVNPTEAIVINNNGIGDDGVVWLRQIRHSLGLVERSGYSGSSCDDGVVSGYHPAPELPAGRREYSCIDVCFDDRNFMIYNELSVDESSVTSCQLYHMNEELYSGSRWHTLEDVPVNYGCSHQAPTLLVPEEGAEFDNGTYHEDAWIRYAELTHNDLVWDFDWQDVPTRRRIRFRSREKRESSPSQAIATRFSRTTSGDLTICTTTRSWSESVP